MPLEILELFSSNWLIRELAIQKLREHDEKGTLGSSNRVYIGDTRRLGEITRRFADSAKSDDVASAKVFARLTCVDARSKKYHLVELYQTERDSGGRPRRIIEATWTPRRRTSLSEVVAQITETVTDLTRCSDKYTHKPLEIVGSLHAFRPGKNNPPRRIK